MLQLPGHSRFMECACFTVTCTAGVVEHDAGMHGMHWRLIGFGVYTWRGGTRCWHALDALVSDLLWLVLLAWWNTILPMLFGAVVRGNVVRIVLGSPVIAASL
jgi:hypothetical protein